MTGKESNRKRKWYVRSNAILLLCVILLLVFFLIYAYKADRKEVSDLADETISFLETVCKRYDNYALGQRAASLEDVLDKAEGLRDFISEEKLGDDSFLEEYAETMGLSGVAVTDVDINFISYTKTNGKDSRLLWENYLLNENKRDIVSLQKKSFSSNIMVGKTYYDVAIVSRKDSGGLILCYVDSSTPVTDLYEVSLEQTLTNNTFHKNPRIVITDGDEILAANVEFYDNENMIKNSVESSPVTDTSADRWKYGNMIRLRWGGQNWYGKRQVYGKYYIYVFYPAREVFTDMIPVVTIAVAVYAVLCMVMMTFRRKSEKRYLERERKQLSTIKAISSLYTTSSVLHLKEQQFETIQLTERAQKAMAGGKEAAEVVPALANRIIAPDYRDEYVKFLDVNTMAERLKEPRSLGKVFKDVNNVWHSVYLVAINQDSSEEVKDVLVLSRNINDYKQKEEEYQEELKKIARDAEIANAAKTSFLRRMSHDVRTPVNGIRGMAMIAERTPDAPPRMKECVQKIITSSDYLLALLDDVLSMGQLESGRISYEKKPYNIRKVISDTAAFIEERASEKGVDFQIDDTGIIHEHVIGSPLHLRQILQNVMSNAVKFNREDGSIKVTCKEISVSDKDGAKTVLYEFVCADTGIGISEEFQKHVFDTFAQEEKSARTHYEHLGSGLGLPIAKEILEQRGGSIDFVSEKGKGTVFTIRIPIALDVDFYAVEAKKKPAGFSIEGIKILLAEDNELNMEIARCLLEDEGAVVTEAYNGKEAVDVFSASEVGFFDVILMDIMMPKMDGLEATREIRKLERVDAKKVLIFAMTANAFAEDAKRSLEAGMNEHLAKPLEVETVVEMICKYCRR